MSFLIKKNKNNKTKTLPLKIILTPPPSLLQPYQSLLSTGLHSLYARYRSTSSLLKPLLPLTRNSHSTPLITLLPLKNELDSLSKLLRDVENTLLETLREDVLGLKDSLGDCKEVDVEETLDDLVQQVEELRLKVDVRREEVRNSEEVRERV